MSASCPKQVIHSGSTRLATAETTMIGKLTSRQKPHCSQDRGAVSKIMLNRLHWLKRICSRMAAPMPMARLLYP